MAGRLRQLCVSMALFAVMLIAGPAAAGAAVDQKINFQPSPSLVPAGYTADSGAAYADAIGSGWVREDSLDAATHVPLDVSPNARERNAISDQRLDTFIHMQFPASVASSTAVRIPAAWEMAVAPDSYVVTVAVGDAGTAVDSTHRINVEGRTAIMSFTPTATTKFATATVTVPVSDGRLTIDARGGTNTKIDYVDIKSADTVPP